MTAAEYKKRIDEALADCFLTDGDYPCAGLAEAMRYSLLAGGKRIRPTLVLEFCRISGGDVREALPVACAIEMLHTYSLIHDDLPCMDNDDLRRGRPTNHVVYGECTATLAGDALQAEAFGTILRSDLPAERRALCAGILADAVGLDGMCGGQFLDMLGEGKALTEDELTEINARKTGALLTAACRMGVAAAGGTPEQLDAAARYGAAIGMAFQIRDDMLDVLSTKEELGKPIGSDAQENKNTYMALLGEKVCMQRIERLTAAAKDALQQTYTDTGFLFALADSLASRRS
ncbi:MAG: polyprenyl synthetase family protein [Oscillospiraceae bacterium]|nr:polyprenyl synthetase family protein [Oscillospiraceae bacterium]